MGWKYFSKKSLSTIISTLFFCVWKIILTKIFLGCSDYVYRQPNVTQTHEGVCHDMVYGLKCPKCRLGLGCGSQVGVGVVVKNQRPELNTDSGGVGGSDSGWAGGQIKMYILWKLTPHHFH